MKNAELTSPRHSLRGFRDNKILLSLCVAFKLVPVGNRTYPQKTFPALRCQLGAAWIAMVEQLYGAETFQCSPGKGNANDSISFRSGGARLTAGI